MSAPAPRILLCNCEKTMEVDGKRICGALGMEGGTVHTNLCRREIDAFEKVLGEDVPFTVACTQEAPLFSEIAEEQGKADLVSFTNIRERAGWTAKGDPTPKMAALIRAATLETPPSRLKSIASDGVCLVYGRGQAALEAARMLNGKLSVSLVLNDWSDLVLPSVMDVPVHSGKLREVRGSLGRFEVTVDAYAPILPSSRGEPEFLMARNGAKSNCSVIVDISGDPEPLTGHEKRDGYLRADPGDPLAVMRTVMEAGDLVGEFEKPLYVSYNADLCAHGRSSRTGCTNCIDLCPAGAVSSIGDLVAFDELICGGCGACAAHCPTGAVTYDYPRQNAMIRKAQVLISGFLEAGGKTPVLLLHDARHGEELIAAMARFGRGLPVEVIPMQVHSTGVSGHDLFAAAAAAGASGTVVLASPSKRDDLGGLEAEAALFNSILDGLKLKTGFVEILLEDDPDGVEDFLWSMERKKAKPRATFDPLGTKRSVARAGLNALHEASGLKDKADTIPLPDGAPYGRITIDAQGCTLCLACVSCCPANALRDNPERPQVSFVEDACVQCGLCASTCPEKVITLEPRLNFADSALRPEVLHEEEPFECISCGKPFGTRSTIERISEKLAGKHWMFQSDERVNLIRMCDDCRIQAQADMAGGDPFNVTHRPRPRTTDDYIDAREKGLTVDDFIDEE